MPESPVAGPSRDRIIDLLQWQALTVDELAEALGLTPNGVRAHLAVLERDGDVERVGVRQAGGVGKPPTLYGISVRAREARSTAYPVALSALVQSMAAQLSGDALDAVLRDAGRRAATPLGRRDAASALEQLGATVRRTPTEDGGYDVAGASCPLATAVAADGRTCELVRTMLADVTGREVTMCCHHGDAPRCGFHVAREAQ